MLSFKVKFRTDGQTDRQTARKDRKTDTDKTICPRSFDTGAGNKKAFNTIELISQSYTHLVSSIFLCFCNVFLLIGEL